jgi:diguanylate cyclase (GGDEF)-like protein
MGDPMNPSSRIARFWLAFAVVLLGHQAAALAQTTPANSAGPVAPATPFDAQVAAAKGAMMGDPEAALQHAHSAVALSSREANANTRLIQEATGHWLEGEALIRVNRPEEARPAIDRGMAIAARYAPRTKLHADLLKARAALSIVTGSVQPALRDLLVAHEIYRRLGEARSQAIVLQNLGSIYLEARDFDRALSYYEQANDTYSDDPALTLAAHNNRGNALKELGRYADAEREFAMALEAARASHSDLLQARILANLASAQTLRGDLARAEATARLGLQISQRSAVGWEPFLWGVRAQIALRRGDLPTARTYIERTFAGVNLETSTLPYREFHDIARQVYFRLGDAAIAYRHFTAFKRLDDEGRNVAASTNSALMTARFDAQNQELRITRLKADQLQRDAALVTERQSLERLKLIGLIAAVVALIVFAMGFVAFRAVQRSRNRVAEANVKLNHAARHDALTDLPNRRYVRELLQERLSERETDGKCALMLIDLDRFKMVNDTLGHEAGDALLLQVGNRLHEVLPEGAHAGRLGGDEFAAVLPTSEQAPLERIAGEIVQVLSAPFDIDGSAASIGASVGISLGGDGATTVDVVTRNADLALYHSKNTGRERFTFFEPWMLAEADERRRIEADLRTALIENQFTVAYQPIVEAEVGEVVAFEALVRWQHPTRGEIMPAQFIPVAEEAGLIRHIGDWVLRTACAEASRWPEHVKLAVNLSAVQVEAEGLVASVVSALAHSGLSPDRLEFEVTESVFLREGPATGRTLDALRSLGVTLALDDFGTGYSSLGYLQRTEFSKIKIDRSFVHSAAEGNEDSLAIIKAIVSMARGLGMATTAEGVETEAERQLVRDLGCSQIQGFLVGRPEPRYTPEPVDPEKPVPILVPPARRRSTRAA